MPEKVTYYLPHLCVTGMVQGVGFRFFAINRARKYGITGWVRNLYDGRVEIEAEGNRSDLEWHEIAFPRYKSFSIAF